MKKCISCAKDIPDTAFHCVFCGAKQGAPQQAGPAQRTIMGYAASDLQKLLPNQPGGAAQGGYVPTSNADQRTMMAGVGGAPMPGNADQRTMMAGVGGAPMPGNADQRTMMAGVGGAPMPGNADQRTMMAGVGGAPMPPMQQMPMPPMQQMPQQPQPMMGGYPQQPPIMQAPQGQRPQYLASQSAARDLAPTEPWAGSLRKMMIIFGLILVATVVLPLSFDPMTFMWKVLTTPAPMEAKLWPLVLAAGGFLALLFGLLPVPTTARGIVAAIVGILPFVLMMTMGSPGLGRAAALPFQGWMAYVVFAGIIIGPTGLLLRSKYRGSGMSRVLALVGCGAIIALFLIPQNGSIPLIGMFKAFGEGGIRALIPIILLLVLFAAAALGLLVTIMPSSVNLGTGFFAVVIMAWFFALMVTGIIMAGSPEQLFKAPAMIAFIFDFLAWPMLAGYGLATVLGKSLEA